MKVKSESEVAHPCPTQATPWTAAYQAPPSMVFSRQEYWSGLPLPSLCYVLGIIILLYHLLIPRFGEVRIYLTIIYKGNFNG